MSEAKNYLVVMQENHIGSVTYHAVCTEQREYSLSAYEREGWERINLEVVAERGIPIGQVNAMERLLGALKQYLRQEPELPLSSRVERFLTVNNIVTTI